LAPIGPPYPTQNRTWTWQYNPNLIAQDAFPPGQRITDLPPRDFDRILQTWNSPLNLPLGVAPQTPFAQYDWPLPRPGGQPDRSFIAVFPLPLVGQDRLPAGYRAYDLPPRAFEHPNQNRTFTATFPPELVGQDRLPNRQMDWPLPTIAKQPENRTFMASYNPNLVGQDAFPPGRIVTDLPPIGPEYPMNLRFFSQSPAVPVPAPPPVTGGLHEPQFFTTMGMSIGSPLNPTSDS